jgi:hypothetical protein
MTVPEKNFIGTSFSGTPFSSEQACVVYLFRKRWPRGFKCPFCGTVQQEIAPAYAVVCRYCRKQISITAHTLMHGSKKSLVAWMRVSWKFCSQGISARELQRLMELSCYQTAWSWLQKIRCGAALAESAPCGDIVLFDLLPLPTAAFFPKTVTSIGMALELSHSSPKRVRLIVLQTSSSRVITAAVNQLVEKRATLLIRNRQWLSDECQVASELCGQPTGEQLERGHFLLDQAVSWLNTVYRKAVNPCHLQGYLDEFCFRHNTASWPDPFTILDHLLTGLLSTVGEPYRAKRSTITGAIS